MDELLKMLEVARANLERDAYVLAVLRLEGAEDALVGIRELPGDADGRRALFAELGRKLRGRRPQRVSLVVDAYMGTTVPRSGSLADDPGAVECLVAASLDRQGRADLAVLPYERIPRLEGTEFRFGALQRSSVGAELSLLEAFFRGVDERGGKH